MPDRLSTLDVSFLYLEEPTTPMHVGGVAIFQSPPDGFDYDRLSELITQRIGYVPRYRQKIRWVPGHLANPVWVDDEDFDISFHVRRSALPKPGNHQQLRELVARIMSRPLDRHRPLWELYLVEGLSGGRFALLTKSHHAMVDGISAVDICTVILDPTPEPRETPPDTWRAAREPSRFELVAGAVAHAVRRPTSAVEVARTAVGDVRQTAGKVLGAAGGVLAMARTAARPAPHTPLNVPIGEQRRYGMARTDLDDYKRVRKAHGGTVNDVVLAVVAGALRSWLLSRGEAVTGKTTIRAMVPVSVRTTDEAGALGNRVSSYLVDLPVGEPNPVIRLHQVSHAMRGHKEAGQAVGADALVALSGFAPPTLHALGARVANSLARRVLNVVVTNVPGPQFPLYAAGAQMLEAYPVVPLAKGQAVSIGLTSYNGGVYYGLNADRDAMPDLDVLAQLVEESLAELVETVR
jgi:WS/DGAT/MGAT family acyltransferase